MMAARLTREELFELFTQRLGAPRLHHTVTIMLDRLDAQGLVVVRDRAAPPWITRLADDERLDGWDHAAGVPGVKLFSNALQVWAYAQGRVVTVDDAALAFNVPPEVIRRAVEWHYWLFITEGDVIESEGE